MDDRGMMNRRFSLGARGYNQDEVDSFLHQVAEQMWAADADPSALADSLAGPRFSVVTLGYSRNEVHQYMDDLRVLLRRRAERQSTAHAPAEDTVEVSAPEEAEVEAAQLEFVEDEVAASASTDEPAEVVYANGDGSHRGAHRARNREVDETVAERPSVPADDERAELFATALDLRVEAAVSMTRDQLREAIALVQGSGNGAQAEAAQAETPQAAVEAGSLSAVSAVLQSMRSALDALDALVAEEMAHRAAEEAPAKEQAPAAELEARTDDPPVPADQDEVRAGILTMTRDIIRFARGGSSGQ